MIAGLRNPSKIPGMKLGIEMVRARFKYVIEDVDRHGNVRMYFRKKGRPKVRLFGLPGSDEFMDEYRLALRDVPKMGRRDVQSPKSRAGSLKKLCEAYFTSAEFKTLDSRTQRVRRNTLDKLCHAHGDKPAALLLPHHVRAIRDAGTDVPEATNSMLKALRQVFTHGININWVKSNPVKVIPYLRSGSTGFHAWTNEEIAQYEQRHPVGTKARLAFALLFYTGQRRSDVVRFGRHNLKDGSLFFTQQKNKRRKPITLQIPIADQLQEVLSCEPCGDFVFLLTDFGRPFTANGFGNKFREWCDEAGLPHCSAHGLRKAAGARLAEKGATEMQIRAFTGHRTSKEVSRYTQSASQALLAKQAIALFSRDEIENKSVPPKSVMMKSGTKTKRK